MGARPKIENEAWVLPRPSKSKYIGSFPLHFEKKLLKLLNIDPDRHKILHPFGGKAEFGIRTDIKLEVRPDCICDAHDLCFKDDIFDLVILDPPYSEEYSKRLYKTNKTKLKFGQYVKEAVRVLKENGYLAMYHYLATPRIENTILVKRIFLETRLWHKLRCVHIHRKRSDLWKNMEISNDDKSQSIKIRRLTPVECERLQGFPDGWTEYGIDENGRKVRISDTQRYRTLGNAVTTNVVEEIAKRLIQNHRES